jgi:YfiH family protein
VADPAWLAADWPAPEYIGALTTLRSGAGVSEAPFDRFNLGANCGDAPAAVAENRRRLVEIAQLPAQPRWLRQVHGIAVADMDDASGTAGSPDDHHDSGSQPIADAARTARPGTVLAVLTADCLPVLFCDAHGSEVAAAHAGWRGLAAGVLEATIRAMRGKPENLLAWLGPAAGPQAYEVGEEVRAAFVAQDARAGSAFEPTRPGHWRVDLYALARQRMIDAGVKRIHGGGLCTISDPQRYFSHRRDGRSGRMASLIWIKS